MAPRNVEDVYPLTPMQRLMLLHAIARPGSATLINQVRYEIDGPLDVAAFRTAWEHLVERHPALRTAILWEGLERPLNVVREVVELPFFEADATESGSESQERLVDARAERDAQAFDLGRAPLMRCSLVRRRSDRHTFIWTVHHLVVDRWSHGILMRELRTLYEAAAVGRRAELREPARFRDYVAWSGRRSTRATERFWRDHLAGVVTATPWLTPSSPPLAEDRRRTVLRLGERETGRLDTRAAELRTTPASLVLASVAMVLAERNETREVVTGLTVSGRPGELSGVEEAVGSFVNNVPMRVSLPSARSLGDWVRDIRDMQARRQPHEHVALDEIGDWSDLPAGRPLFDGLVVLNLLPAEPERWSDLGIRPTSATLDAGYPVVLQVARTDGSLEFTLVHSFEETEADDILDALRAAAIRVSSAAPDTPLGEVVPVPGATASERSVPVAGQPAPVRYGSDRSFLEQELLAVWREVLGRPTAGLDDNFFELGGTSLQAAQIFRTIERITGRPLSLSLLVSDPTVRDLLEALEAPPPPSGPLVQIVPGGEGRPMVAVPGIGGNVVGLYRLARELSATRPFYGLQSRGLDGRAEPLTTIGDIAADFADEVSVFGSGGVHLMGVCWGSAVAFEMARRLEMSGVPVRSLALLDPSPLLRSSEENAANVTRDFLAERLRAYWAEFRDADWSGWMRLLGEKGRLAGRVVRGGGRTDSSEAELRARRVEAANRSAVQRYRPDPLGVRARVFFSEGSWQGDGDPRLEWLDLIDPRPGRVTVPGFDSGQAITAHAVSFATAWEAWLEDLEATSR